MPDIFVGSVSVGVVPDASNWNNKLRAELVPSSSRIGDEIGRIMGRHITDNMNVGRDVEDSARRGEAQTARAGAKSGKDFSRGFKAATDAELADYHPDVTVDVHADTTKARAEISRFERDINKRGGILGRIAASVTGGRDGGGILGRLFGAAETAVPAVATSAGAVASTGEGISSNALSAIPDQIKPLVVGGIVGAVVAAAPFIAQAIAGAVVSGFGLGIAGMAIIGAIQSPKVKKVFDDLKKHITDDFKEIGKSWVPVLTDILGTARDTMDKLTPVFAAAAGVIAGPFKLFADTIITAFTQPEVKNSIKAVADAFGKILTAFTPDIPGIVSSFADSIKRIAEAVSKNPKAFADFLNFIFQIGIFVLNTIAILVNFVNWLEQTLFPGLELWAGNALGVFRDLRHGIANQFDLMRHDIAHVWDIIYNNTIGAVIHIHRDVQHEIDKLFHGIASTFDSIRHTIASAWDTAWDNTVGRAQRGVHDVEGWFISLKNWVTGFFAGAGTWLYNGGRNIVTGLWNGIKSAWNDVVSWFKGMPHAILHALGIASPPPWSIDAGKHIMGGLLKGIAHGASDVKGFFVNLASDVTGPLKAVWSTIGGIGHAIGGFFSRLVGAGGSGVGRWAGVVAQALAMLGLSQSLAGRVLYQMQTESGGNPNAINNWDINAQRGDPSRGLMQTIGSTFAAYHVPGTSTNIYDPLANVAAALNYARTVYGPDLMRGSMGIGSGHGYDTGGWLPPGVTLAINRTGEPELVLSPDQLRAGLARGSDGAVIYNAHFDGLTGQAIEGHVRTAFAAMSVTQGNLNRSGRRR